MLVKFNGSKVIPNLVGAPDKAPPTDVGLGTISSSGVTCIPAPNLNSVFLSDRLNVVNLLEVFNNFKTYGTVPENCTKFLSLSILFSKMGLLRSIPGW